MMIDLQKVFDAVDHDIDHDILLQKMKALGFDLLPPSGQLIVWIIPEGRNIKYGRAHSGTIAIFIIY